MEAGQDTGSFTDKDYARSVIHPRADPDGVLSPLSMFDFGKVDSKKARTNYVGSVARKSILATEDNTHSYGCRLAERGNKKRRDKIDPTPLDKWNDGLIYVGYFDLKEIDILSAKSSYYEIYIEQKTEDGEDAHCNIVLQCRKDLEDKIEDFKGKSSADRTAVINYFFSKKHSPRPHTCPEDLDEQRMPELHTRIFGVNTR